MPLDNERYMQRAISLAKQGEGTTAPNPMVGAVLVKDGRIIGEGWHQVCGQAHAEVNAIQSAGEDVAGATIYVTLEPCSHFGKTPPCADLILQKGIKKAVVAMVDPNPLVAGQGIQRLRDGGVEVEIGCMEAESRALNERFLTYITQKRPFVLLKSAMTLDGKIAAVSGQSQWISCEASRQDAHKLRGIYTGIMAGIGTVLADNPRLTCRTGGKNPIRIIVDSRLQIPETAAVLNDDAKTILAVTELADGKKAARLEKRGIELIVLPAQNGHVPLFSLMEQLAVRKIDSILLEGGATLAFAALEQGCVDKIRYYIAPKLLGGVSAKTPLGGPGIAALADAVSIEGMTAFPLGTDWVIEGYPKRR